MSMFLRKVSSMQIFQKKKTDNPCNDGQWIDSDAPSNNSSGNGDPDAPLNNAPPSDIPPTNSPSRSLSNDIPRNILAFRTITTMLAQIRQEQPFKVSDPRLDMSDQNRHELKISNALATVAVTDKDIVAVTTKRHSKQLEVIVCTRLCYDHENQLITQSSPSSTIMSQIWQLVVTKNFRMDDPEPAIPIRDPTLIDTAIPAGLEPDDDEGLKQYLEKRW